MKIILFFLLGSACSSFIHCSLFRYVKKQFFSYRSCCDFCHKKLVFSELIPIFSYFLQGGKCRCKKHHLDTYSLVCELLLGISFSFFFFFYPYQEACWRCLLCLLLDALAYGDYLSYTVYSLFHLLFLLFSFLFQKTFFWQEALLFTFPFLILKLVFPHKIGGGDLEYFFVLALLFGYQQAAKEIFIACFLAFLWIMLRNKKNGPIAMLPFFCVVRYLFFFLT